MTESEAPRIIICDASKVVHRMIQKVIIEALPNAEVIGCASGTEALEQCESGAVDLVTTALALPDMDGMTLCRQIREASPQRYIPIILVSGDVNDRLVNRDISDDVTDYFDKSHGFKALGAFVRGYVLPPEDITGNVLYVEDSRVVALATRRMLEASGLTVSHVVSVEEALEQIGENLEAGGTSGFDIILTDVYLKGGLTGKELLEKARNELDLSRRAMPILVMTGDDNPKNQSALLRAGANDLVEKPIDEKTLINKLRFQLQLARGLS
ncbi:MAG: response regulator [Pseudomonadota bacterium]